MTAEIAILNKSAVALAADSAMTVTSLNSRKIYPANKLFELTKRHPVGVMIYNYSEFMGVPWETIIKMYRNSTGEDEIQTIEDYVVDFLLFIRKHIVPTEEQELKNFVRFTSLVFYKIMSNAENRISRKHSSVQSASNQNKDQSHSN